MADKANELSDAGAGHHTIITIDTPTPNNVNVQSKESNATNGSIKQLYRVAPPTGPKDGQQSVGTSQSYDFDGVLSDCVEEHPDFEDAPLSAVNEEETVDIENSDPLKS